MSAPHGRSWGHYVVGIALNALAFAVLGPLAGAILVLLPMMVMSVLMPPVFLATIAFIPMAVFAGYHIGWKSALLTGALVGILSSYIKESQAFYLLAGVLGAIACFVVASMTEKASSASSAAYVSFALLGAIAALVCTYLTKGLRLRRGSEFLPDRVA